MFHGVVGRNRLFKRHLTNDNVENKLNIPYHSIDAQECLPESKQGGEDAVGGLLLLDELSSGHVFSLYR